ncbi:unnamed protein product [Brachionus calyciflorus]|uniref:Centrosomal protein of 70 kDa n=1 Tax=Brachionus calyciflorus TaxID=104777 RepID=A0A814F6B0_9BILA|nr:unnamed protein product [Brachionus calyciflorus]
MLESFMGDYPEIESFREIKFSKHFKPKLDLKNFKINQVESVVLESENDLSKKTVIDDQHDDLNESDLSKDDYIQMVVHYKTICKSLKKQLIESHKTIKELHLAVEHLEKKNWNLKKQKYNEPNEHMRILVDKCAIYCEKINKYSIETTSDEDSACPNDRDYPETKEELIVRTLQSVLKEKKEFKNFTDQFKTLIETLNPTKDIKINDKPSIQSMSKVLNETLKYAESNSINKFQCKCNGILDFNKEIPNENLIKKKTSSSKLTSSSSSLTSSNSLASSNSSSSYYNHKPSQEFLLKCLKLFQELFDVDCFLNVPTKMNDIYYKYGQLVNFKKAIQNIFDPNENSTTEKLVCNVQNVYKLLNDKISNNLKEILNKTDLEKVIDKFSMYDEYFPLFHKLLEQIMKALEISRLDQIMPSIRALKILATPSLC